MKKLNCRSFVLGAAISVSLWIVCGSGMAQFCQPLRPIRVDFGRPFGPLSGFEVPIYHPCTPDTLNLKPLHLDPPPVTISGGFSGGYSGGYSGGSGGGGGGDDPPPTPRVYYAVTNGYELDYGLWAKELRDALHESEEDAKFAAEVVLYGFDSEYAAELVIEKLKQRVISQVEDQLNADLRYLRSMAFDWDTPEKRDEALAVIKRHTDWVNRVAESARYSANSHANQTVYRSSNSTRITFTMGNAYHQLVHVHSFGFGSN